MMDHIILFDGVCNLCNGFVKFIIKRDPAMKFKFATLQSETGKFLMEKFELSSIKQDSVVYIKGQNIYIKSTAALLVFNELRFPWMYMKVFYLVPKFIRDFFYTTIAKSRYFIFGKKNTCIIPDEQTQQRFLD